MFNRRDEELNTSTLHSNTLLISGNKSASSLASLKKSGQSEKRVYASRHTLVRPKKLEPSVSDKLPNPQQSRSRSLGDIRKLADAHNTTTSTSQAAAAGTNQSFVLGSRSLASCKSFGSIQSVRSNVSFQSVSVREYPRCLGDNPSVSSGPPISIGWKPQKNEEFSIDDYEAGRVRSSRCARIPARKRAEILLDEWEETMQDVVKVSRDSKNIRNQRKETMQQTKRQQKVEELMESSRRALKKVSLKLKKSSGDDSNRLKRQKRSQDNLRKSI